jgi:class 3 adenylate cyclase
MDLLAAYLPTDRLHALAGGTTLPSRARGTVLFADISGFTPLTEALVRTLGPRRGTEELARQLNEVYDALIVEVDRYGGSVIGFGGDAITCWFDDAGDGGNTPTPNSHPPSPARDCMRANDAAGDGTLWRRQVALGRHRHTGAEGRDRQWDGTALGSWRSSDPADRSDGRGST